MRAIRSLLLASLLMGTSSLTHARTLILVLPSDYAGSKETLTRLLAAEATEIAPGDRMIVLSAENRRQVAAITYPEGPNARNKAWVRTKIAEQFAAVRRAVEALPAQPAMGMLAENLHIPDVLGEIGRNQMPLFPEKAADVVLIGSVLYFDPRDGRFAMTDRYYASDAHIKASAADTPYGTTGRDRLLAGATIHMCPGREAFATKDHEEAVRRFWTLWIAAQGGRLGTFSFDPAQCLRRARASEASGQEAFTLVPAKKLEMLRAHAPIPAVLPPTQDRPGEYFLHEHVAISREPPTTTKGVAWVGLRWRAAGDIDLYTRADATRPWLFFGNTQTEDGRFNKDHRSATGETQFEFVEYTRELDLTKAQVAINFYEGQLNASPEGVIRVWFDRRVYEATWKIAAHSGNGGAPPMSGPHWLTIDLRKVVGLSQP